MRDFVEWSRAGGLLRHTTVRGVLAFLVALAASGSDASAIDIELGRYLGNECLSCHRTSATAGGSLNIFGMPAPTFTSILKAYRDKKLANPVMQTIAGRLTDEEIEALAAYFAITKRP